MPQTIDYHFGYYVFAPQGRFEPCGMFTFDHIVASIICIILIIVSLTLYKKGLIKVPISNIIRFCAISLTCLEIIKIAHSFIYGDIYLDAWFPLSYCGLFIFALWMAGFGEKRSKRIGEIFIAYGCPFAGVAFLIFPTTSLMLYPIWHYFSLYSLLFHSLMIFVGIILLFKENRFSKNDFLYYAFFVIVFATPAIVLNTLFNCNLMNLREPYNIPIDVIQLMYTFSEALYTIAVIVVYMLIPLVVAFVSKKIKV